MYVCVCMCVCMHVYVCGVISPPAVSFQFVVFRPFIDEILVGKIRSCSSEGVRGTYGEPHELNFDPHRPLVSLGFFDDIIIPQQSLQHPKRLYLPISLISDL